MKQPKLVPQERQEEDKQLMRWLYSQGIQPWEMAEMRVGSVDEFKKTIRVHPPFDCAFVDEKGNIENFHKKREKTISFKNTPYEQRLRNGAIYSGFLFTKRFPLKRLDSTCGYSVEEIEEIVLTKPLLFDNIEVSKENIESQEQEAKQLLTV